MQYDAEKLVVPGLVDHLGAGPAHPREILGKLEVVDIAAMLARLDVDDRVGKAAPVIAFIENVSARRPFELIDGRLDVTRGPLLVIRLRRLVNPSLRLIWQLDARTACAWASRLRCGWACVLPDARWASLRGNPSARSAVTFTPRGNRAPDSL